MFTTRTVLPGVVYGTCLTLVCMAEYLIVMYGLDPILDLAGAVSLLLFTLVACERVLQPAKPDQKRSKSGRFTH